MSAVSPAPTFADDANNAAAANTDTLPSTEELLRQAEQAFPGKAFQPAALPAMESQGQW